VRPDPSICLALVRDVRVGVFAYAGERAAADELQALAPSTGARISGLPLEQQALDTLRAAATQAPDL
jgi:hypothetical protein